ncbi:hypothetical protein HHL22_18790 [Hymenobacter sp. RP-2-7]|uniref:Uncharacterized protein n=1 Tax=Hymenobacter polaris TaxID=2682546 RepID=A0A7Y0AH37_9BACT|nr:hypothetical protein [Hymenobacter polaris]NML67256.1 hypothetical protein [Hymenobacter polaris]
MKKYLLGIIGVALLSNGYQRSSAQGAAKPTYMQVFYEGSSWLSGRPLLHYSPAFRGKTDELVPEPDSTKRLSPGAFLFDGPAESITTTSTTTTIAAGDGQLPITYVHGQNGKLRPETAADRQQARAREQARFDRQLNLVAARATLARNTLTNALNAAAADGWEVVQLTQWGKQDGLVYLLRRR